MAIVRKGTLTVGTGGVAQNLILGFVPNYIRMENNTKILNNTNGVQIMEWWNDMPNASSYQWTTTSGTPVISYITTNGFTPLISTDVQLYPSTNLTITGISRASAASITATHAFTSADVGVTVVSFHGIVGMTQMNTLSGVIQSVTSTTSFTVNINSTNFSTWTSGGIANIVTGSPALQGGAISATQALGFPPAQTATSQVLNTALFNAGGRGLILGTSLMVTTADVIQYIAYLDTDITSA